MVNGLDPVGTGIFHRVEVDLMVFHEDPAGVGPLEPAQDLDQRAFAGPVVTDKPEHLAPVQVHVDAAKGHDRAKALGDVLGPQNDVGGRITGRRGIG